MATLRSWFRRKSDRFNELACRSPPGGLRVGPDGLTLDSENEPARSRPAAYEGSRYSSACRGRWSPGLGTPSDHPDDTLENGLPQEFASAGRSIRGTRPARCHLQRAGTQPRPHRLLHRRPAPAGRLQCSTRWPRSLLTRGSRHPRAQRAPTPRPPRPDFFRAK